MRRPLVLFGFAALVGGCGGAAAAPVTKPADGVARARVEPAARPAVVTGCRAEPSTVYGAEPVVFAIEGPHSPRDVAVELRDRRGQTVGRSRTPVPSAWRVDAVPSGDFELRVGEKFPTCWVTVNRELSRATETQP